MNFKKNQKGVNELNIKDKTIVNYGVEHNIYRSIKYPNKLIKVGPDFIVNEWYYVFEENPDLFPKVYGMYPLKNREWIKRIGIQHSQMNNFFDESEYYYVVIEELDTKRFLNLWNQMNEVNGKVNKVKLIDMMEYDGYEDNWDNLLDHVKDSSIYNEIDMFYSLIKRLHDVKDGPDLHERQFGFDSKGVLKALDI
jgi:predicted transglutaminase-like cysteine proteinase